MDCPNCGGQRGGEGGGGRRDCDGRGQGTSKAASGQRGSEQFNKWKKDILAKADDGGEEVKHRGFVDDDCREICKQLVQKRGKKSGCTCCTFMMAAAVLLAAGITIAFIKKKYID